jgi:5-methylthioadenosine/S-adenosylhomocysteine deaminase
MKKLIIPEVAYCEGKFLKKTAVLVENGEILKIGCPDEIKKAFKIDEEEVWEHMALLPGTVNIHNHCFQSLLRGLAVGKPFLVWRDQALYKISPMLAPEDLYIGALFAFGEMMKYGVTCVSDFFYVHNDGTEGDKAIIRAARDLGIRLVLARTMYDWEGAPKGYVETIQQAVENTRKLALEYNGRDSLMTTVIPAPHSLHAASAEMVQAGHSLADELGTKFHIHVAEEPFEVEDVQKHFGMRPVELLDELGVLDRSMVMVHAVWLSENELKLMADKKANLAYCPSSNMFLADGITNISWMQENGIKIGLGSDGACSNNRISVFEEMRMASLLQKVSRCNALLVDSEDAFDMGTKNGGELLDLPIGIVKEGYKADFTGVDLTDMSLQPLFSNYEQLLPNIVYSMQPTAIKKVVVNGVTTVDNGKVISVHEQDIVKKVDALIKRIEKE